MKREKSKLDLEIEMVEEYLGEIDPDEQAYAVVADNLNRLYKMRDNTKWHRKVDPNVVISCVSSLIGIFSILKFEKLNVISSKAIGFIRKF